MTSGPKRYFLIFGVLIPLWLWVANSAFAVFVENFGHIGTIRVLKGQVRDSLDELVPNAEVRIKNVSTEESYLLTADEKGVFRKDDLRSGKYLVSATDSAFNISEFTVRITPNDPDASNKFAIVRLSPGCASGNSGVKLLSKLTQRSFKQ
jgi:hypothetical protein